MTESFQILGFGKRELTCFVLSALLHSPLLLWKAGVFNSTVDLNALGDSIVSVDFVTDQPVFTEPESGESEKSSLFEKMKSIIKGTSPKPVAEVKEVAKPVFEKTEDVFKTKEFKQDAIEISKGNVSKIEVDPSHEIKTTKPLKQDAFQLAKKDAPFPIINSNSKDALANVNQIPIAVGKNTSPNVKSINAGPAIEAKAFTAKSKEFKSDFSGGAIQGKSFASGSGAGKIATGSGFGEIGKGTGSGPGVGSGSGLASGRSGSGGKTFGSGGTAMRSTIAPLVRNTVKNSFSGNASAGAAPVKTGFHISGDLANRGVLKKTLASYEKDCRVALRFLVDWSGKVLDGILVEISSGSPTFDNKVIAALKQWLFTKLPGTQNNEVQEGVITFVFKGV